MLAALLAIQLLSLGAIAQSAEFGRGSSSDAIKAIAKTRHPLSGSLALTRSTGTLGGNTYDATLGGELLDDRLWFFAAASVFPRVDFSTADFTAADFSTADAIDAKATAQPVDWTSVTGSFHQTNDVSLPSSFFSLRSTSMLSDHAMLDFSVSRTKATRSRFGLTPLEGQ